MVKTHSQIGYDILKEIDFGYPIAEIILPPDQRHRNPPPDPRPLRHQHYYNLHHPGQY
jgi:hypothetical protein